MRPRGCVLLLTLAAIGFSPREGRAQGVPPEVATLLRAGIAHRVAGRDDEALRSFEAAYATRRAPVTAGQLALALQAVGRWVDADGYMREALAHPDDDWVQRHRRELAEANAILLRNVGSLELPGAPAGATVMVDGVARGTLPQREPLRVRAGVLTLEIRAAGCFPFVRQVTVIGGERTVEPVSMTPLIRAEAVVPVVVPRAAHVPTPTTARIAPPRGVSWTGWILAGGGIALGAVGAVSLGLREASTARFNAECPPPGVVPRAMQSAACQAELTTGDWTTPTAVAGLATGAVLLGVGAVLLLMPARDRAPRSWWCGPNLNGATCAARF
jgi:hypothetical protein